MTRNHLTSSFSNNHAFLIAVQDYRDLASLQTPINDVKGLAEVLKLETHDFTVHPLVINPGKEGLEAFFSQTLPDVVKSGDRVLIYFAGHGIAFDEVDQTVPKGYLVPADAHREDEDSFVSMDFLNQQLQKLPCRHLLLLLDCCFAGTFQWADQNTRSFGRMHFPKTIYQQRFDYFLEKAAWQVITSASSHQKALDFTKYYPLGRRDPDLCAETANSPFALALLRALRDGAGDKSPADGLMTVSEIFAYLQDELAHLSHVHSQKPAFFPLPNHKQGEFVFLNPKVKLHLSDYQDEFNPYRGLQAYDTEHRGVFYGRERVVSDLLAQLNKNVLLVVSGDSGTGKSSVVKAGLMPELEKQGYRLVKPIRPGTHPLESLEAALRELAAGQDKGPAVLVVDQLEELATQYAPEAECAGFLSGLAALLEPPHSFQKIILTVRSDFETIFDHSPLAPYWQPARYAIPGFEYEELQTIVLQPMQERCIEYEEGLAEELIREVHNKIGGLPLLSFTLSELYERFKARRVESGLTRIITWDDYRATGGVVGSLQKGADQTYDELPDDAQRASLRHLMLRLTSLSGGETAGRRVTYEELHFSGNQENQRIAFVRDKWIERRLLRSGKDSQDNNYVEPAHDALVRSWKQMQTWIQEYRGENILLLAKLGSAVKDYQGHQETKEYLWHNNPSLEQVYGMQRKDALSLNSAETQFLERSRRLKYKNRNIRNAWIVGAFVALVSLTIWALNSYFGQIQKGVEAGITSAKIPLSDGKYGVAAQTIGNILKNSDLTPFNWLDTLLCKRPVMHNLLYEADSLRNSWTVLRDTMTKANFLLSRGDLRGTYHLYLKAEGLSPRDSFIIKTINQTKGAIEDQCKDLRSKGRGFMLYSEPDTAIVRFKRFLEIELTEDKEVRQWLRECEARVKRRKKI